MISFRGSSAKVNWVTNIDYFQVSYPDVADAYVHEGFYKAYFEISDQLIAAVDTMLQNGFAPSKGILATGHSLGGALATFAAVDLRKRFGIPVTLYNFGSPRTGNQAWTDYVMETLDDIQRVTHYNDVVPHVPMTVLGFNHVGQEVWYSQPGDDLTFIICQNFIGSPESKDCAGYLKVPAVDAHLNYLGHPISGICRDNALDDPWKPYLSF